MTGPPNDTIYERSLLRPSWSNEVLNFPPSDSDPPDLATIDLEPMIVPPAAVKSPYYGNRTIKALWTLAGKAIRKADEIAVVGFSLPPTDMIVSSMLCTQLPNTSRITPVNYRSDVVGRIAETFGIADDHPRIDTRFAGAGNDAIPLWVDSLAR